MQLNKRSEGLSSNFVLVPGGHFHDRESAERDAASRGRGTAPSDAESVRDIEVRRDFRRVLPGGLPGFSSRLFRPQVKRSFVFNRLDDRRGQSARTTIRVG